MKRPSLAFLGGTFDPIHFGHLNTSIAIQKAFYFDSFYFLPCNIPVLKPAPFASNDQRIQMIQLAIQGLKSFHLDYREIKSPFPSYTINSLRSIREENRTAAVSLIIGYDAFASFDQWHQWESIIDFAHLLVLDRPEFSKKALADPIQSLLNDHQTESKSRLLNTPAGSILLFNAGHYSISSTEIRKAIKQGQNVQDLLPKPVYEYIQALHLYQ